MPNARGGGPIFVVGAMGSGTTLMRLILDSHENIAIAQETTFARVLLANLHVPFWKYGGEWYHRLGWSDEEFERALADFYSSLFRRLAEERGATRWGDKSPHHAWHMPLLARIFPDAVFIVMLRHPGASASSMHRRFSYQWKGSVSHWLGATAEMVHQGVRLDDRVMFCRYEDLLAQPEAMLRPLFDWLGEPWSSDILDFHRVHRERGTASTVEGSTRSDEPLDAARARTWSTYMDEEGHRQLLRASELAALLGYDIRDPAAVQQLRHDPASAGPVTGAELAPRVAASTFDWSRRPKPSLPNQELRPQRLRRLQALASAAPRHEQLVVDAVGGRRAGSLRTSSGGRVKRLASYGLHRLPASARRRASSSLARAAAALR